VHRLQVLLVTSFQANTFFETLQMKNNIQENTIKGLYWSFFERIGYQGIQFLIAIILARLLLPDQFGLIAMLAIFMAVAQSFVDSGFSSALIQKQDATHLDECSIFYFNIVFGFLVTGSMFLSAPWIAAFYRIPLLTPLVRVLSLNLIINAFGVIQTTLLTKRIDFKSQMKVSAIAAFFSGSIGVAMANQGYGVWSLVAQSITNNFFRTILLWFFLPWRPSWIFSFVSLRSMFPFGSKLLFSGLLDTIYNNLYLVVIGKMFSATALGYYTQAEQTVRFPVSNLSSTVGRVTFPVFSSLQDDKDRLKRATRKALSSLAMVNFPLMIGMAVVAKPLVLVVLTDKWLPCVPYLQLLCIAGILYPLHVINLNVLMAQGRSDLFFRLEIYKKATITAAICITAPWGIMAMIYGQIATSTFAYYLNSYYTGRLISYPASEQIKNCFPILSLASLMGFFVFLAGYIPLKNNLALLFSQVSIGIILYISFCSIMRIPSFVEIRSIMQDKFQSLHYPWDDN
jgi:O-antigen/teichoic acid export membrane protein